MRALTVDVKGSAGRILCCTIFRPGGRNLLAKGHVLSDEDVRTRIKVGVPVSVHYITEGDNRVISRVELDED